MQILEYFKTPIWIEEKPEFIKSLNKASDPYIKKQEKEIKIILKNMVTLELHIILHL